MENENIIILFFIFILQFYNPANDFHLNWDILSYHNIKTVKQVPPLQPQALVIQQASFNKFNQFVAIHFEHSTI